MLSVMAVHDSTIRAYRLLAGHTVISKLGFVIITKLVLALVNFLRLKTLHHTYNFIQKATRY